MIYDVIIIGGGPAGLFAAGSLNNKNILLLEKNDQLGKKLLISGAGQCNYTKYEIPKEMIEHYGSKRSFVKVALNKFKAEDAVRLFKELGLPSEIQDNKKVFPESRKANDVLEALMRRIKYRSIIKMKTNVTNIVKDGDLFTVTSNNGTYQSKNVLITTGGASFGHTGSVGDGFRFAKDLGHHVIPQRPSLMPVYVNNFSLGDLSGIGFEAAFIDHYRGKKLGTYQGELLITHKGLSGPLILNNGRYMEEGDRLLIRFNEDDVEGILNKGIAEHGKRPLSFVLNQLSHPNRLIEKILSLSGISRDKKLAELKKEEKKVLIGLLTAFDVTIDAIGGLKVAMATAGGVDTAEINKNTFESKLVPGLYFAGEVIDVDGDTGGYNIHFAFASGRLAALAISKL